MPADIDAMTYHLKRSIVDPLVYVAMRCLALDVDADDLVFDLDVDIDRSTRQTNGCCRTLPAAVVGRVLYKLIWFVRLHAVVFVVFISELGRLSLQL